MWICMRCQQELATDQVQVPSPRPCCGLCHVPLTWEVDIQLQTERWVCSRCPFAGPTRLLVVQLRRCIPNVTLAQHAINDGHGATSLGVVDLANEERPRGPAVTRPLQSDPAPRAALGYATAGPPSLPLSQATYSCVYMPVLLDAAGLLHAETRAAWRAHPVFGRWWEGAVSALLARPFLTVRNLQTAVGHVLATSGYARPLLAPFFEWCIGHAAGVTSLSALMQDLARPADGHYLPGPLQEVLLATLLGEAEALALARRLDEMRQDPAAAQRLGLHVGGEAEPDAPQSSNPAFADSPPPPPHEPAPARPRLHLHWGGEPVPRLPADGGLPTIQDGDTAQSVTGASPPPGRNNTSPAPIDPIVPPAGRANVSQPRTPRSQASTQPDGPPQHECAERTIATIAARAGSNTARGQGRGRRGGRGRGRHADPAQAPAALHENAADAPQPNNP